MNPASHFQISVLTAGLILLACIGCHKPPAPGALVVAQSPVTAAAASASDILDATYPPGSRVVLVRAPFDPKQEQVLSEGLASAGNPIVSYDGQKVFFAGKVDDASAWQIYQADLTDARLTKLTFIPGGAMSPALLSDGSLVFASPVPRIVATNSSQPQTSLYVQSPGGQPRRLTFSSRGINDPIVLPDGRILFVSTSPSASSNSGPALFTINNDGTEVTAFAAPEDFASVIQRPRLLADGRVVFVVSKNGNSSAEVVGLARPFQSRAPLFPVMTARVHSVQPAANGDLLVCAENAAGTKTSSALFRANSNATALGDPLLADTAWNILEAVEVAPHLRPMGRLSTMDATKTTGKILCLDANFFSDHTNRTTHPAKRVRVNVESSPGNIHALGEVPVQADGSFLAEVPADVPIGFESLDENGRVLRHEAPMLWLRPAENRSCIGCHEPHNRAPHNHRPLAVSVPITQLTLKDAGLEPNKSN